MQKYGEFTNEQLRRMDEIYEAFDNAVRVLVDMPEAIRKRYGIGNEWSENEIHSYAMRLADTAAEDLTEWGSRIYFPWENEETGIHDICDEEI